MNYIVMDLEWNRPQSKWKAVRDPFPFFDEIIQIGAVKVNEELEELDRFSEFVKPSFYHKVHKDVTELTDITTEMLQSAQTFEEVCTAFLDWCGEASVFVTWSGNDKRVLERNMRIHDMDESVLPMFYDVQLMFDDQVTQEDRCFALNYAMWKLGITAQTQMCHNALNDALNTVAVMRELDMEDGLEGYEVDWEDDEDYETSAEIALLDE